MTISSVETFDRWQFSVDRLATIVAYSQISEASVVQCGCGDVLIGLNIVLHRFLKMYVNSSSKLGLIRRKNQKYQNSKVVRQKICIFLYIGEYQFIGNVISGPDPFVPTASGNGCSIEPIEVAPGFKLGLSSSRK